MADFNDFLNNLLKGLEDLTRDHWQDFKDAAEKDGNAFFKKTSEDLQRWTKMLADKELSKTDFEFLVAGKKDLAEMEALKQAGLALVRVEKFRNALISLIVDTAVGTFL